MTLAAGHHLLWPTPLGIHRYADANDLNPLLARIFGAMRATAQHERGEQPRAFFASDDDLLHRVKIAEFQAFVAFLVDSAKNTIVIANRESWPQPDMGFQIAVQGMWFQCANQGAFHDVHTHGNCSWSGVYIVQVDSPETRTAHPVYGAANGVTRFYGPPSLALAGASVDLGNAYLQPPHVDLEPVPGQLVLFPSALPHQALAYDGKTDRIIISFNISVNAISGTDKIHSYNAA